MEFDDLAMSTTGVYAHSTSSIAMPDLLAGESRKLAAAASVNRFADVAVPGLKRITKL